MKDTKERILDAAEGLFAAHGFADTSLRKIVREAKVNLASVHYHFHSKEALLEAVVLRRAEPLDRERLELLDAFERRHEGHPSVEEVLEAFILPTAHLMQDPAGGGLRFAELLARLHAEAASGSIHAQIVKKHFGRAAERFVMALARALPDLPLAEIFWRANFAVGVVSQVLRSPRQLGIISGGLCRASDFDGAVQRAIAFTAAGFRAPVKMEKTQEMHS